jgi:hypothetical protein
MEQNLTPTKEYEFDYVKKSIEKIDLAFRTQQYKRAMLLYVFLLETLTETDRTYVIRYYYDNISKMA